MVLLYNKIIENLSKKFNITNEKLLTEYMGYRYCLIKDKDVPDKYIVEFMLKEFDVVDNLFHGTRCNYNEPANSVFDLNAVYGEIMRNCFLDKKYLSLLRHNAKEAAKRLKNQECYESYLIYFMLTELNKDYHVTENNYVQDNEFEQLPEKDRVNLEEMLEDLMNVSTGTTVFITEKNLEDYLLPRLNLIEDGLKLKTRQYILAEGRIDILAEDKDYNLVIIELKIETDKKIVWQSLYYPMELHKKFPNRNIRMIAILPECPDYLLEPLIEIGAEVFEYDITIIQKQIQGLTLVKRS